MKPRKQKLGRLSVLLAVAVVFTASASAVTWNQVLDWDRENDGDSKSDIPARMNEIKNDMGVWSDESDHVLWREGESGNDGASNYLKYSKSLPNNDGNAKLQLDFHADSYEQSGISFYVEDVKGNVYSLRCEDDGDVNDDGLGCGYDDSGDFTWDGTWTVDAGTELSKFYIASAMEDNGNGDSSRLYHFTVWVGEENKAPNASSNPDPADGEVVTSSSVKLSAEYRDPEHDSGTLRFYDGNDNLIGSCSVNDQAGVEDRCGVSYSGYGTGGNDWYVVAEDSNGQTTTGPTWTFYYDNAPSISLVSPSDGATATGNSVTLEADVSDPDGDDLTVNFYNNETGDKLGSTSVSGGSGTATYDWTGLSRGEKYRWHAVVTDGSLDDQSDNRSFSVNQLPTVSNPEPPDPGVSSEEDTTLSVYVDDPDASDNSLDVRFYDAQTGTLIGEVNDASPGEVEQVWSNRQLGSTYRWYVEVSDDQETFSSSTWEFRRVTSTGYRADTRIDYDYTSVITSTQTAATLFIEVENFVDDPKDLTTTLTVPQGGAAPVFVETGSSTNSYTLPGDSTKRMEVRIEPSSAGKKELVVKTTNDDLGIETREKIPLYIRKVPASQSTREVPGIGMLQVLVIFAAATLLSASL
ncbi:MAG: Ig-like domain-containing protein [Candidatus Nanohaloarchaea archaeon]